MNDSLPPGIRIEWMPPPPRAGWGKLWDLAIGSGSTPGELRLAWLAILVPAIALPAYAACAGLPWTATQYIVAAIIASNLCGAAVVMAQSVCKRWLHRPRTTYRLEQFFMNAASLHPFVIAWLYSEPMDWRFAVIVYGYLIVATLIVQQTPLSLQRPVATSLVVVGCAMNGTIFTPPDGFVWFAPVYYLKLLMSHLVFEVPFRPAPTDICA